MAVKSLYCIRDHKVEYCYPPFPARNDQEAMRLVSSSLRGDTTSPLALNPEDFSLFHIGSYDDSSGTVEPAQMLRLISHIQNLIAPE